jgi:hypothetical protein
VTVPATVGSSTDQTAIRIPIQFFGDDEMLAEGKHPGLLIPRGDGAVTHHEWPEDCGIQGGTHGVVFRPNAPPYQTAFFEAFPSNPITFIRGEGKTVEAAEDQAWESWQRYLACPGHDFEKRRYRNGGGICRYCGLFKSDAFEPDEE